MGFLMAVPGICVCAAVVPLLRRELRRMRLARQIERELKFER